MQRRKESEELLRAREYRMHLILETAHEGIAVTQGGRIVYFNRALPRLFGYTAEELLALPSFAPLVHPEDLTLATEKHASTWREKQPNSATLCPGPQGRISISGRAERRFPPVERPPRHSQFRDGHQRPEGPGRAHPPPGHPRCPDRTGEPFFLPRSPGTGVEWSRKEGKKLGVLFVDLNRFKP
jgi:hypothetical protein